MKLFTKIKNFFKKIFKKEQTIIEEPIVEEKTIEQPKFVKIDDVSNNNQKLLEDFQNKLKDSSIINVLPIEVEKDRDKPKFVDISTNIIPDQKTTKKTKKQTKKVKNVVTEKEMIEVVKNKIIDKKQKDNFIKKDTTDIEKIEKPQELKEIQEIDSSIYKTNKNPKYDKIVIFLTPGHTDKTPGKHSPDNRLMEWKYNRIIVEKIEKKLDELGIKHWNSHPEDSWVDKSHANDNKDLQLRVQRINKKYEEVKKQGKTAIMLSIHVNAAGNGEWYKATGWSAWTTKGQNNSDKLADCLYEAAEELLKPLGKKLRYDLSDGDKDYESNFYVIKHVNCVAALTENFFMDNMEDVDWLLSKTGQEYISLVHVEGIKKYIEKYIK